jgi:O-antigen/teichoic acid export membrane protein
MNLGIVNSNSSSPAYSCRTELGKNSEQQYFEIEHLPQNLKDITMSGGAVRAIALATRFCLNLASTMILARLLLPHDFGLVAMVTSFIGFFRVFRDGGLSTATIQRHDITHAQVSNLFWINVAIGGLAMLSVAMLAPAISWFYREPKLMSVTLVLSITFILSGSSAQHLALLNRKMRFAAIALGEIASAVFGVVVSILTAWAGFGYWSLVYGTVSSEIVATLLIWLLSDWRPQMPLRHSGTRPLLGFGANLSVGTLLYSLARGSDNLLIGRFCESHSLGLYSRASALLMWPLEQILSPFSAVFLPALSRLQHRPIEYRRVFLRMSETIALIGFSVTGMLLALAHPLTLVLLGSRWEKASSIFAALSIAALYIPLATASTWLLISQGRGRDILLTNSILSVLTVTAFVVGLPFGATGVALSFAGTGLFVRLPILYYLAGRCGPVSAADLWSTFLRHVPIWFVVSSMVFAVRKSVDDLGPLKQLLICGSVGIGTGMVVICGLRPQREVAIRFCHALRDLIRRRPLLVFA